MELWKMDGCLKICMSPARNCPFWPNTGLVKTPSFWHVKDRKGISLVSLGKLVPSKPLLFHCFLLSSLKTLKFWLPNHLSFASFCFFCHKLSTLPDFAWKESGIIYNRGGCTVKHCGEPITDPKMEVRCAFQKGMWIHRVCELNIMRKLCRYHEGAAIHYPCNVRYSRGSGVILARCPIETR